LIQLSR
jgi:hypothetical protein